MEAIIEKSTFGNSWTVYAGKGRFSGFSSEKWAIAFCEKQGYTIIAGAE